MPERVVRDAAEVVGVALVETAVWLVDMRAGLIVLGAVLLIAARWWTP